MSDKLFGLRGILAGHHNKAAYTSISFLVVDVTCVSTCSF